MKINFFSPGYKNSIFKLAGIKVAIVICYELEFPEIIRNAALKKVNIIISPTAQSNNWPAVPRHVSRSRAF